MQVLVEGAHVSPIGDEAEPKFADWVASRQHRLLRTAYLITGDLHRAEDLVQDALIKVGIRWNRLRDGNPDAYVRTVLYRDNISWWRRKRESPVEQVRDVAAARDEDAPERRLVIRAALAGLTVKQRAVLVLRFFDDFTERETAQILGISVGTVKSQTSAALARLRERAPELAELINETGR
jgi:RNA polymerase sigma-70 factor (sigma-E family)